MTTLDPITVDVFVHVAPARAWHAFTDPSAITEWNFASPEWHCPRATNDLRPDGAFSYRMEARDGSFGFDFEGAFIDVVPAERLRYSLGPDREVTVTFAQEDAGTRVRQTFTPENTHPLEQQRAGWQAILDNYRTFVDGSAR